MAQATPYDAIVLGSSRGGRLLPIAFAQAGRNVALIERDHVGGTCINVGCTPTKTMVASARLAYLARRGADYGVHTGPIAVDLRAVRQRKQGIVAGARRDLESRLQATPGLDLLKGEAHFLAPKTLAVHLNGGQTRQLTAPLMVIDTGDRCRDPPHPGLRHPGRGGWRDYDHHPGGDDGQAALHRLKRWHVHPSHPG